LIPVPNAKGGINASLISRARIEAFFKIPQHADLFCHMINLIREIRQNEISKKPARKAKKPPKNPNAKKRKPRRDEGSPTSKTLYDTLDWFYQFSVLLVRFPDLAADQE